MMSNSESLFNPQDDSLSEKVNAYYTVCQDFSRVQASLKQTKRSKNTDFIGDHDEVVSAYNIISQSLIQASSEVSKSDLLEAKKQGLLSDNQVAEITQTQHQHEISNIRQQQTRSNSSTLKRS